MYVQYRSVTYKLVCLSLVHLELLSPHAINPVCLLEFEKRDGLTPEEAEQSTIAKRKMLGNIRFVGKYMHV